MQIVVNTLYEPIDTKVQNNFHGEAKELLKQFTSANKSFASSPFTFLFVLDKNQCEYLYLDGSLKKISSLLNYNIAHCQHEDDTRVLHEKIFPELELLCRQNNNANEAFTFTFNFRVASTAMGWLTLLQNICPVNVHPASSVLYFIGTLTDITHYKNDDKIIFVVEKNDKTSCELIKSVIYSSDRNAVHLTKREIEVLKCINDGLSSKQIANKLFASLNTINNHRKNILRKTHTKNTSELIGFALKKGLID